MKKSYDYFKTLNVLSESVSIIYEKSRLNEDFEAKRISFFAEKSELLNNLRNEFIAPLERSDIFLLAENLTDELNSALSLQEYFGLIKKQDFQGFETASDSFKNQNIVFSQLKNFKSNLRLFEQCSQETKRLNTEKKKIEKDIVAALYCQSEQPLIKYATYSSLLDLNRSVYKTFLEIERILVNNS